MSGQPVTASYRCATCRRDQPDDAAWWNLQIALPDGRVAGPRMVICSPTCGAQWFMKQALENVG